MKMIIFISFFIVNVIIINSYPLKKLTRPSCGPLLVSRVKLICSRYGGYNNLNTDGILDINIIIIIIILFYFKI